MARGVEHAANDWIEVKLCFCHHFEVLFSWVVVLFGNSTWIFYDSHVYTYHLDYAKRLQHRCGLLSVSMLPPRSRSNTNGNMNGNESPDSRQGSRVLWCPMSTVSRSPLQPIPQPHSPGTQHCPEYVKCVFNLDVVRSYLVMMIEMRVWLWRMKSM